jgi:hypothetical protein
VSTSFVLGYLGIQPPSDIGTLVAQVGTLFYFGFFLLMPWWSQIGDLQARARPRDLQAALSPGESHTMKKTHPALCWPAWPSVSGPRRPRRRHRLGQVPQGAHHRHGRAAERRQAVRQLLPELPCGAFMRYNRLRDIGLTEEQIKKNLLFTGDKVGDLMKVALDPKEAKEWFGACRPT